MKIFNTIQLPTIFVFLLFSQACFSQKGALVLIPGTGNSLIPGHFSDIDKKVMPQFSGNLIEMIRGLEFDTLVARQLKPFGDFKVNGKRIADQVKTWYASKYPKKDMPLFLLGHSAGGFYALHAASLLADLPLRAVITVSTPLKGSQLADAFLDWPDRGFIFDLFDFRGLKGLETAQVQKFLKELILPDGLKVFSAASFQNFAEKPKDAFYSEFLHPLYRSIDQFFIGPFDGIIGYESAKGVGVSLRSNLKNNIYVEPLSGITMQIGHSEQVMDYRVFSLGTKNPQWVKDNQEIFFRQILDSLTEEVLK